jgi:hypothetical protein
VLDPLLDNSSVTGGLTFSGALSPDEDEVELLQPDTIKLPMNANDEIAFTLLMNHYLPLIKRFQNHAAKAGGFGLFTTNFDQSRMVKAVRRDDFQTQAGNVRKLYPDLQLPPVIILYMGYLDDPISRVRQQLEFL